MMRVVVELSERELAKLERNRQRADLVAWLRREAASRNGEMGWYVARTRWQADSVASELRHAGIEAVCPMWRTWKRYPRSTRRYAVDIPMFGNHLFVRLLKAESAWVGTMSFEGVACLLGTGERPVEMRQREIDHVMQIVAEHGFARDCGIEGLMVGDKVVHPIGSIAELSGTVLEIDGVKRTALIEAVLFGRTIETRCGIDDLQKLS